MSKSKVLRDNVVLLFGGNLANVLSFFFNVLLLREDQALANLYVTYNSVVLILGAPSLVLMRLFTVYGSSVLAKFRNFFTARPVHTKFIILLVLILLFPLNLLVQKNIPQGDAHISFMLITLAVSTMLAYAFRGLKQHEEKFLDSVISLNIETGGRLILGYVLGIVLGLGISGVLIGAILSMVASLLGVFDVKYFRNDEKNTDSHNLINAFMGTLIFTFGMEFFLNFDIFYSLTSLQWNLLEQTEYNALQILRKIIFHGIAVTGGLVLSLGSKKRYSDSFIFSYTFFSTLLIGACASAGIYFFRNVILDLLKTSLVVVDTSTFVQFLIFASIIPMTYLLANLLFSKKRLLYTLIPLVASIVQVFLFSLAHKDINGLLAAFFQSSIVFFVLVLLGNIYEIFLSKRFLQ